MAGHQLSELNAFVAVAEYRNFGKAATHLGLSRATISETVRTLEERLGVRLLNRTTRSVAPTEAGERLLSRLRPVLDDYEAALESINAFRDRPAGHLRVTMPGIVASWVIAPMLPEFLAQYPDIGIEIVVSNRLRDIVAERFDAGIRIGNRIEKDMIAIRVTDDLRYAVLASPDYLKRHGVPKTPDDLQGHNCIRFRFPSGAYLPWKFLMGDQIREVEPEGTLIVNDPNLAIGAARNSVGLFYGPVNYIGPLLQSGELVSVLGDWLPTPSDGFFLFYPSRRQNPVALQTLIEFLRRRVKSEARAAPASIAEQDAHDTIAPIANP